MNAAQLQGQPGEHFPQLLSFGHKEEVFDIWKAVGDSCSLP